jgi:hypothetical protein
MDGEASLKDYQLISGETDKTQRSVSELVADATIYGYASNFRGAKATNESLGEMTEKLTAKDCFRSSARALYYLNRYRDQFKDMFLLESVINTMDVKETTFTRKFFRHYAWCAIANDGTVYIGSPNNANREFIGQTGKNPLTTIHQGNDLQTALQSLTDFEGSIWPSAQEITKLRDPRIENKVVNIHKEHFNQQFRDDGSLKLNEDEKQELMSQFGVDAVDLNNSLRMQFQAIVAYVSKERTVEYSAENSRIRCADSGYDIDRSRH